MNVEVAGMDDFSVKLYQQASYRKASSPEARVASIFGKVFLGSLGVIIATATGMMVAARAFAALGVVAAYLTFVGVLFYCPWIRRTLRYEIREDSVTIVRAWPFRQIVIPIIEIIGVSRPTLEKSDIELPREGWSRPRLSNPTVRMPSGKGSIVLVRGMHGYHVGVHGIELFACVTSAQRLVAIECQKRSYLISPEHPDEFVRDIRVVI